jgi:ribosomal protein S18 acetylase RimI-like enzyme
MTGPVWMNDSAISGPGDAAQNRHLKQDRSFRQSSASDEDAVRQILAETGLAFYGSHQANISTAPALGAIATYLSEVCGVIVALLQARHLDDQAEILTLAVSSRHKREGHARFLLNNFLRVARELGVRDVFLEVRESNAAALALYQGCGFTISGQRPNYYRDPPETALLLNLKFTGGVPK